MLPGANQTQMIVYRRSNCDLNYLSSLTVINFGIHQERIIPSWRPLGHNMYSVEVFKILLSLYSDYCWEQCKSINSMSLFLVCRYLVNGINTGMTRLLAKKRDNRDKKATAGGNSSIVWYYNIVKRWSQSSNFLWDITKNREGFIEMHLGKRFICTAEIMKQVRLVSYVDIRQAMISDLPCPLRYNKRQEYCMERNWWLSYWADQP